jgi:hypothetical protein
MKSNDLKNMEVKIKGARHEIIDFVCGLDDSIDRRWRDIAILRIEEAFLALEHATTYVICEEN